MKTDLIMLIIPGDAHVCSAVYTSASIGVKHLGSRLFSLPRWVTLACAFNNTASLFLLLLQSLDSVESLGLILRGREDTPFAI